MIQLPPPIFDFPYPGVVVELVLSAEQVAAACRNPYADACMIVPPNFQGDKCFIVLPRVGRGGVSARSQELLRRHEHGHCNGWRH